MRNNEKSVKASAIVTIYKDGPAIPYMYKRLKDVFTKINIDYEIIFVNDCSPDNAREILLDLANNDKKVVVINHSRNFGSQNAFTSGMKIATGDFVVLLDGDLQDPPELIESFYERWCEGYQVVYGQRVKREAPLYMQFFYKIFYRIFNKLSYISVPLDAGDFSLIDRKVVDALNSFPESNRFIRGIRAWAGFKQIGIPYVRPERMFGRTTNSFLKNLAWARKGIFSYSYAPLDFITLLSLIIVTFSGLGIILEIIFRLLVPSLAPSGFTTIIILILFTSGVQLLCLAIVGSYLSHIYDEVKHRPPFIIDEIFNDPGKQKD